MLAQTLAGTLVPPDYAHINGFKNNQFHAWLLYFDFESEISAAKSTVGCVLNNNLSAACRFSFLRSDLEQTSSP